MQAPLLCVVTLVLAVEQGSSLPETGVERTPRRMQTVIAEEKDRMRACELQVLHVQKMTKEFLYIAYPLHASEHMEELADTIRVFNTTLNDLLGDGVIQANEVLTRVLKQMEAMWATYRSLLESTVSTVGPDSLDVLEQVEVQSRALVEKAEAVLDKFIARATYGDIELPPVSETYARRQLMLLQKLMKEAVFVGLGVKTSYYVAEHITTARIWEEVQASLTLGNLVAGIPPLSEMCTMHTMFKISHSWVVYKPFIESVHESKTVSRALLIDLELASATLEKEMEAAVQLFEVADGACDSTSSFDEAAWSKAITEINRQQMLGQLASRIYLEIATGANVGKGKSKGKDRLAQTMTAARESLQKCLRGDYSENIPPPPTQEIVDQLMLVWTKWQLFEKGMLASTKLDDYTFETLAEGASRSKTVLDLMAMIANMYVRASLEAKPMRRSVVESVSLRQLTLLQKMSKEAVSVSLGIDVEANNLELSSTISAFEASHWELLLGRSPEAPSALQPMAHAGIFEHVLFKDKVLPRTTDACTLTVMETVLNRFNELKYLLGQLVDEQLEHQNGQFNETTMLAEVDTIASAASTAMATAADFYKDGHGTCSTSLSALTWDATMRHAGYIPLMAQSAQTQFYLLATGHAKVWMDRSEAALVEHKEYILEESKKPVLTEAITAFKKTWDSYSGSEEETRLGLQVAYITLNPHPAGEKDKLDYSANNPEEYHAIHKQYHPLYRTTLYDRNFYDIFMFDLEGNLIYSVYKELDYATNFAANGSGIWRTSGLGEAFEAAMKYPDKINVIDWKPYGPSAGALASFLSVGVRDSASKMLGVFCTQMPPESKPINVVEEFAETLGATNELLRSFRFGKSSMDIPPPPDQVVADTLFEVIDRWELVQPVLTGSPTAQAVASVASQNDALASASEAFLQSFVDGAWAAGSSTLQGTKVFVYFQQLARVKAMCKDAILISMGAHTTTRADLAKSIQTFEADTDLLLNGNLEPGTAATKQTDIKEGTDPIILSLLNEGESFWSLSFKPDLQRIVDGGEVSEDVLKTLVEKSDSLITVMNKVVVAMTTRTTTLMPLEILTPMPLTGSWAAGPTMKVAALLAEGLINEQQAILPGYALKSVFFDDRCDAVESSRLVLAEMAAKDTYIALGGAGCSNVCEQTAFVASTIRLPFLSYECSAASLSDEQTYPELTRLGTVTTPAIDVIRAIGDNYSWPDITVIAGDPSQFGNEGETMRNLLLDKGFESDYVFSYEKDFDHIVSMMSDLKTKSTDKNRVYFVVGTEGYFRKVLCASIVSGAKKGITWLSRGAWRDEWWKKSDQLAGFHNQWLLEDRASSMLREMFVAFEKAWVDFRPNGTNDERRMVLSSLYSTDQKEKLDSVDGPEQYHKVHEKWHPIYRQTLYSRSYYDIFIFDLNGDCIYSVYKESDYATNFAANGDGKWKDSGLGDAFAGALANPDNVSYVDFKPYGPSAGALAAFLATGIRDENGILLGVYVIQLPPDYERSIEVLHPECSLAAMTDSFEGALNVVGLGRPTEENMVKPLPCFGGHSARSFLTLLDRHLQDGYPLGDRTTQVEAPYGDLKANAADAVCVLAFTVKHLLDQGYSIQEIQKPNPELYAEFLRYVKTQVDFQGVSGHVKFSGNDKPGYLVVQQVRGGSNMDVGTVSPDSNIEWINGGPSDMMWQKGDPEPDAYFPYWVFQTAVPLLLLCVPTIAACVKSNAETNTARWNACEDRLRAEASGATV